MQPCLMCLCGLLTRKYWHRLRPLIHKSKNPPAIRFKSHLFWTHLQIIIFHLSDIMLMSILYCIFKYGNYLFFLIKSAQTRAGPLVCVVCYAKHYMQFLEFLLLLELHLKDTLLQA